ncbi:MAG TPA: exosortase/archaeosortase family protein [Thermoplasmata archaeon]|nr:exosortase/archaeosortase family protein [Thermoplasmata archaeon]
MSIRTYLEMKLAPLKKRREKEEGTAEEKEFLASRLISILTKGRMKYLFPAVGVALIVLVPIYNFVLTTDFELGGNDFVVLILGFILLFYNQIPYRYKKEKDFAVVFFTLLLLIVVLPTTYYAYKYDTTEGGWEDEDVPNSPIIETFLARPVSRIVRLFGVDASSNGVKISYEKKYDYREDDPPRPYGVVSIALGCTGLYSVSIFLSGFIAFISVEYKKLDQKVAFLLLLGILTSYLANLLRMSVIILVGSYYGMDALLWTHKNLGEIIFLLWIGLFWSFMFKYLFEGGGKK